MSKLFGDLKIVLANVCCLLLLLPPPPLLLHATAAFQVGEIMCRAVRAARDLELTLLIDGSGLNFIAERPQASS